MSIAKMRGALSMSVPVTQLQATTTMIIRVFVRKLDTIIIVATFVAKVRHLGL